MNPIGVAPPTEPAAANITGTPWPVTAEERREMYRARWRSFRGEPYTLAEVQRLALFRAVGTDDVTTAITQRIMRDGAFVCGVDAAAIATDGVTLGTTPGAEDRLDDGRAQWEQSAISDNLPWWATNLCVDGLGYLEVFLTAPGVPAIVWHQPTSVEVSKDRAGSTITQAVITILEPPAWSVSADGSIDVGGKPTTYRRLLTPAKIAAWRDDAALPDETGPNTLGRVPLIEVAFAKCADGSMPLNACQGIDDAIALINSTIMQIGTIGSRNANPTLLTIGARLADGADMQKAGKVLSVPADADIKWLELSMTGLRSLVETMVAVLDAVRQTMPEFLFVDSGANSSGTALSYRAGAFVAKIQPVRARMYAALAEAVSLAVCLAAGRPWSPDEMVYAVDGGSPLPMDVASGAALRQTLMDAGLLRREDVVSWLQAARVAPEGDPAGYAAKALAEMQSSLGDLKAAVEMLQRMQGADSVDDVAAAVDMPDPVVPADEVSAQDG